MVERQIGQSSLDSAGGGGTVRMGKKETLEIGGEGGLVASEGASFSASEEPFVSVSKVTPVFSLPTDAEGADKPEIVGGGSSRPSAAFRES